MMSHVIITTVIVAGLVSPDWFVEVEAYASTDRAASRPTPRHSADRAGLGL